MGILDSPLTPAGRKEAARLHHELKQIRFDKVISSDLQRAVDTAGIIVAPNTVIVTEAKLRERSLGQFEGLPLAQLEKAREEVRQTTDALSPQEQWERKLMPDLESDAEVFNRVYGYLKAIAEENIGKTILVVTHSGPIRALLMGLGHFTETTLPPGSFQHGQYMVLDVGPANYVLRGIYPEMINLSNSALIVS